MSCQELVELATSYLDGELSTTERRAFEQHLALCVGCDRYLDQLRRTVGLIGAVPGDALSERAMERLLHAFAELRWGEDGPWAST